MTISLEPVSRLSKDIIKAIGTLSDKEARYLVDAYYNMQDYRKATDNQDRAMTATAEPHEALKWFATQFSVMEQQIERALDKYSMASDPGVWMRSVKGIGPVLAANFLTYLDVKQSPTAGGFWRFAGLDPTCKWEKGQKRPFNAQLKVACWKASDSWVKLKGHADSFYSGIYIKRKEYEIARNDRGELAEQAAAGALRVGKTTEAYAHYAAGHLPPGHLDMRARRYTVKLFLAHLHHVMHECEFGTPPPKPYVITHLGHAHIILPPNWPLSE